MRYLIHGVLTAMLLSGSAFAQSAPPPGQDKKPAASDSAAQTNQNSNGRNASSSSQQAEAPAQSAKDDSLNNFDVNGSNAQDAMGGAPR